MEMFLEFCPFPSKFHLIQVLETRILMTNNGSETGIPLKDLWDRCRCTIMVCVVRFGAKILPVYSLVNMKVE